jgi:ATP-dependent DNA helicase RecG
MSLDTFAINEISEGQDFEVKKAAGRFGNGAIPDSFFETYSAMANTEGGIIMLGIEELSPGVFSVSGIVDNHRLIKELWDCLNNPQKVSANILHASHVTCPTIEGKNVIRVVVPRAQRRQRPVYIGANPLKGTFRRNGEGDYGCDEETVKRMMADQFEEARDSQLLPNFTFDDLDTTTFNAYRTSFKVNRLVHPWVDLPNKDFLYNIGGWTKDRDTGHEGLTLAGLLMFGKQRCILDAVPNYILDYQERPTDQSNKRWMDRLTTDGTWSGNLYDFYRQVIQRLTRDLKVPFQLKGTTRTDDTPVHEALREALVNTLIHADFTGRVSLLVVKRPDLFGFRNPGCMRLSIDEAIQGGISDCRNRNLQKMFQLAGLAEQAGSGLNKVYKNWAEQHWRTPELWEQQNPDQTLFRLRMISLLPVEVLDKLRERFGARFQSLDETSRLALATAEIEGSVTHSRLKGVCGKHPHDLSKTLAALVAEGFLESDGVPRWASYSLAGTGTDKKTDDFAESQGPKGTQRDTLEADDRLEHSRERLLHLAPRLAHSGLSLEHLVDLAASVKSKNRVEKSVMEGVIIRLCASVPLTASELADLVGRDVYSLRNHYIKPMVKAGKLKLLYPGTPNHPSQAYQAEPQVNL